MSKAKIRIVVEQKNEQGEWQRVDTTDVLGYCLMMITSKSGKGFSGTVALENVDTADIAMMMMDCGELRKAAMAAADVVREKEQSPKQETPEQIMVRIARENGMPGFAG